MVHANNPNRCEVKVTASSAAKTGASFQVPVYAYNAAGEKTSTTLSVSIVDPGSRPNPVIYQAPFTKSIVRGGTAKVALTGKNIKSWGHGNLPDAIVSVEFFSGETPAKWTARIMASPNVAASVAASFDINAFDEFGHHSKTNLEVTVSPDPTSPGSGHSGCDAGLLGLGGLALVPLGLAAKRGK